MIFRHAAVNLLSWACLLAPFLWNAAMYWDDLSTGYWWPTTNGKLISREVSYNFAQSSRSGSKYQFRVNFGYVVDGRQYFGHTDWNFHEDRAVKAFNHWEDSDVLGDYKPILKDGQVLVHYHPIFPMISSIAPGSCMFEHMEGIFFFGVMLVMAVVGMYAYGRRKRAKPAFHDTSAVFNSALAYKKAGDDEKAIESFTQVIDIASQAGQDYRFILHFDVANSYVNRGEIYSKLGQYQQAIDDFDHAISLFELNPSESDFAKVANAARAEACEKLRKRG